MNLPLKLGENGKPIIGVSRKGKVTELCDSSSRYLFFEYDVHDGDFTLNNLAVVHILEVYKRANLGVWVHRTARGWHFISVTPIPKKDYYLLMKQLKHLNPACPHVTLRIIPNKWIGEKEIFKQGFIISPVHSKELMNLREWAIRGQLERMKQFYKIVTYRQAGVAGDL